MAIKREDVDFDGMAVPGHARQRGKKGAVP